MLDIILILAALIIVALIYRAISLKMSETGKSAPALMEPDTPESIFVQVYIMNHSLKTSVKD